jgi:HK97 gp10 family phage protein
LALVTRVTAQAKALAPVEFGELKNSIMGRVVEKDIGFNEGGVKTAGNKLTDRAKPGEGYVGSNLLHAIYNEFGTRKMAAQPFLRPAIAGEANGSSVARTVKKLQAESVAAGMREGPRVKKVFK